MNKKGAALMQVLLIAVILAGIATMLLRASLSNTVSARKSRRNVSAQTLIESCMAEVNALWSLKTEDALKQDLSGTIPYMYCEERNSSSGSCKSGKGKTIHTCSIPTNLDGSSDYAFQVQATVSKKGSGYEVTYEIIEGSEYL